ncbi:GMC family oxidoreductase N-terminal domain-containing protein [Streptomyces sp. NPDC004610]|uniref:GMC family oxidoreductase n=1 Tax=unclassified Streptomyces TaxID=2593676 RepID=UPI00339F057A
MTPQSPPPEVFTHVVVGAGSAGSVLAARLSEDPAARVLLLEAGPPDTAHDLHVPAAMPRLLKGPYDWDYTTEPQPGAAGRSVTWPSGRVLGGTSSTNAMIYVRGSHADFDAWRDTFGCPGWGYADLLPYFRRAEGYRGRRPPGDLGTRGPLAVEDPRQRHRTTRAWVAAARAHGLAPGAGFNGGRPDGAGFYQLTQRRGRRWSTADAYLRPALTRPNLTVRTGALVTRVLLDAGRAVGVAYRSGGIERQAGATGEVVLCAGAIRSPQLLMLSGIGDPAALRALGIPVLAESPAVGAGLQDHPRCTMVWRARPERGDPLAPARAELLWRLLGRGRLASNGGESGAFLHTRAGLPGPDLQYHVVPPALPGPGVEPLVSVLVTAVEVRSRGRVTLRSADPADPPALDPGYLSHEGDLEVLAAGVRIAREIAAHRPFADLTEGELTPGPGTADEGAIRDWIRRDLVTMHHPTSSCAMGGGPESVCDPQLQVRGVTGLRVADASVFPAVPRGNTNAPVIALAERAADLIRAPDRTTRAPGDPDRTARIPGTPAPTTSARRPQR